MLLGPGGESVGDPAGLRHTANAGRHVKDSFTFADRELSEQKKRLARRYDSYWYSTVKGEWTKREGWPTALEDWKKLQAWIVRKKMKPSAALASTFSKKVLKIFKDLYPLLKFTSIP